MRAKNPLPGPSIPAVELPKSTSSITPPSEDSASTIATDWTAGATPQPSAGNGDNSLPTTQPYASRTTNSTPNTTKEGWPRPKASSAPTHWFSGKVKLGIIIGSSVSGFIILFIIALLIGAYRRRKRHILKLEAAYRAQRRGNHVPYCTLVSQRLRWRIPRIERQACKLQRNLVLWSFLVDGN